MNVAIEVAHQAIEADEVPVGAVFVHNEETVLAKSHNLTNLIWFIFQNFLKELTQKLINISDHSVLIPLVGVRRQNPGDSGTNKPLTLNLSLFSRRGRHILSVSWESAS